MSEEKAAKAFIEGSHNRLFNPYHFSNVIKSAGIIPASMLHRAALGWFRLNEIDYRYGIGDPVIGEMGSRIVHEVLNDYDEYPDYNPGRGLPQPAIAKGTWDDFESNYQPSYVRRGVDM